MAIKLVRNVIWGNLPKKLMNEMTNNNINAVYICFREIESVLLLNEHYIVCKKTYNVRGVRSTVIMLWTLRNTRRNVNRYTIVMYVGKNLMMLLNVLNIQNCGWEN